MLDLAELKKICDGATDDELKMAQLLVNEYVRKMKQRQADRLNKELIEMLKRIKQSGLDLRLTAPDGNVIGYLGKDHINIILEYI